MKSYDVIVIGGGAAGLMCAITAGKRGKKVLILERADRIGKKILISGGGRCNFTNLNISPDCYLSSNPHFCKSALSRYTQWDFIDLVEKYKIVYHEKIHGQLFCDKSSKEILAMLLKECEDVGVKIFTDVTVSSVESVEKYFVTSNYGEFSAASLVIATGGLSLPKLGGSGFGYEVAKQFGINLIPNRAGLVPFTFDGDVKEICQHLSGISVKTDVKLFNSATKINFTENILFTHKGLSGPAILQLSSYWNSGGFISLNLLPDADSLMIFKSLKTEFPNSLLRNKLSNFLPKRLVQELENLLWQELSQIPLRKIADEQLKQIAKLINAWILKPNGTEGYQTAEVTLGGVDTNELSSKTMEARKQPGLYFIGEVIDVTGHLGGFNFQWAWSSGYAAGQYV